MYILISDPSVQRCNYEGSAGDGCCGTKDMGLRDRRRILGCGGTSVRVSQVWFSLRDGILALSLAEGSVGSKCRSGERRST